MNQDTELMNRVLGESAGRAHLQGRAAMRAACAQLAAQATRELRIFSRDLDAPLYDNTDFLEAARQLALSSPHALVKILLRDTEPALRQGHRLIELAQLITSRIQIRRTPEEFDHRFEAYLTADEKGYVLRPLAEVFEGTADFFAPMQVRAMCREFGHIWERSSQPLDFLTFGRGL